MSRLGDYREAIEERDLVEQALLLLEDKHVNFWKSGLRLGNDLLGLHFNMPRGGPRAVRRVRTRNTNAIDRQVDDYRAARKDDLKQFISKMDPYYKSEGGFFEVVGQGLMNEKSELAHAFVDRLAKRAQPNPQKDTEKDKEQITEPPLIELEAEEPSLTPGLHILFSTHRLWFFGPINQVSQSVVTVHNRGTMAIHFEWKKIVRPNTLGLDGSKEKVQRFYLNHKIGIILPGTAYDFPIIFKSDTQGVLMIVNLDL